MHSPVAVMNGNPAFHPDSHLQGVFELDTMEDKYPHAKALDATSVHCDFSGERLAETVRNNWTNMVVVTRDEKSMRALPDKMGLDNLHNTYGLFSAMYWFGMDHSINPDAWGVGRPYSEHAISLKKSVWVSVRCACVGAGACFKRVCLCCVVGRNWQATGWCNTLTGTHAAMWCLAKSMLLTEHKSKRKYCYDQVVQPLHACMQTWWFWTFETQL